MKSGIRGSGYRANIRRFVLVLASLAPALCAVPAFSAVPDDFGWIAHPFSATNYQGNCGVTAIGATLYIVGGEQVSGTTSVMSKQLRAFDTTRKEAWNRADALFYHRVNRAVTVDGKIYSIGGQDISGAATKYVESWDPSTDTWTGLASMPMANWSLAVAAVGGTIYALAGNAMQAYDTATDTWTVKHTLGLLPGGEGMMLANPSMVAIGATIFVAGGDASGSFSNTLWVYSTLTDSWTRGVSFPSTRSGASGFSYNGNFYLCGGAGAEGGWPPGPVWEYELSGNRWIMRNIPDGSVGGGQAVVIGSTVYVAGGCCIDTVIHAGYPNNRPTLSWAGTEHFESSGIFPRSTRPHERVQFKVRYSDTDNEAPAEIYAHIWDRKSEVALVSLSFESGDFLTGAVYSGSWDKWMDGEVYMHYFSAKDGVGGVALGNPPSILSATPGPEIREGILVPEDLEANLPDPGKIQVRNNILNAAAGIHSYLVVRTKKANGKYTAKLYTSAGAAVADLTSGDAVSDSSGVGTVEISALLKDKQLQNGYYWVVVTGDASGKAGIVIMGGK